MTRDATPHPLDRDHWRIIGRGWKLIQSCMHDERISAMFGEMRKNCADPENPTDTEAARVRLALVDEIEALQITPEGADRG